MAALLAAWPYILLSRLRGDVTRRVRHGIWWYGRIFGFLVKPILPVSAINPEIAVVNEPCIIVPNHQSFLDIYLLSAQCSKNLCFVVTSWPFSKLFFFAALMRHARYVRVGKNQDILNFMERCREELAAGSVLVCFPEGTRSRSGKLLPFRSGIFRVATATGAKLVPMIFHNTGKVCAPGSFKVNPQRIFVRLLEPLEANPELEGKQACKELLGRTQAAMQAALSASPDTAGPPYQPDQSAV